MPIMKTTSDLISRHNKKVPIYCEVGYIDDINYVKYIFILQSSSDKNQHTEDNQLTA